MSAMGAPAPLLGTLGLQSCSPQGKGITFERGRLREGGGNPHHHIRRMFWFVNYQAERLGNTLFLYLFIGFFFKSSIAVFLKKGVFFPLAIFSTNIPMYHKHFHNYIMF